MTIVSTNPSRGYDVIGRVDDSTVADVKTKVDAAHKAKKIWRDVGVVGRSELLRKIGKNLEQNADRIAALEAQEMGMPIKDARLGVAASLAFWNSYLDSAEALLGANIIFENDREVHELHRIPRGVAACIVPWNYPLSNFVWQCGQNFVAGNTIVFKHSEETPLCGKFIEEIVSAELPDGVFSEIYGDGTVGRLLVEQDVDFVCFTGSSAVGREIAGVAGSRLIPTSMELGGSAPGIVFDDSDISAVASAIYDLRFANSGQSCCALKRLIVHRAKYEETLAALTDIIRGKKIGDASDEDTDLGPLVAKRQLELLENQVADAVENGATVLTGGKRPDDLQGAYYEPTILTNIMPDMRVWKEETFGPVLPIITFDSEEEAIKLANDTTYGLGGYIFTTDTDRFKRVAMDVESCLVSHNTLDFVRPGNFFGGCKQSGSGREHGPEGFHHVTQSKIITREK
jgi:acyl-CoA reductase-like NAD-dependent aldehyde dehydrogenase